MLADVPGLVSVLLAPPLASEGRDCLEYGMVILHDTEAARRFAAFVLSQDGQAILVRHGFEPISAP